ncbi:class I SAM-dependent methyltransferase [Sphingomonas trueperi]|uniref:class I SAM-dependent methyltransferase n=1 Tax=Sphingomonas trueperi TaxID=53317 RepID=UPI000EAF5285
MSKAAEVAYLDNIGDAGRAHSLFKPFSDPLCGVNLLSMGVLMSLLPPPPGRLLDLGCGGGWTSTFFAQRGYHVLGQDIAPSMIDLAHENRLRNNLTLDRLDFICGDYEDSLEEGQFDCAVFFDSLHHADDEASAIRSVYRALKPGGILLTHEPGEGHSTNPHSVAAMQQYGVNEKDMPPSLIVRHALQAGFSSFRVFPMPQDILDIFYGNKGRGPGNWFLQRLRRFGLLRRIERMVYDADMSSSSIVLLTK